MSPPRVRLVFPTDLVRRPIIGEMVRRYEVLPNIRRADVRDDLGWVICELDGPPAAVDDALSWLEGLGVEVERLDQPLEG
jgi:ABC-type methionine transport system ATPase subunit